MNPAEIESVIREKLDISHIEIENPMEDGLHFQALVVSKAFEGKSLVKQHQMVLQSLKQEFQTVLHALSLKTFTPKEWNARQKK